MTTEGIEEIEDLEEEDAPDELDDDVDPLDEELDEFEDDDDDYEDDSESDDDAEGSDGDDDHDDETAEALEELESQELVLLDDEASEQLLVDEVKELRAIRREELTMDVDAKTQQTDEFVCQSCFLVKRTSQLANRRKMLCTDCAS